MWREVLRVINSATVEGLSQSSNRSLSDDFLAALRHSNEVFAAFKVHQMGSDMAAKLLDDKGHLKPFRQWLNDVSSISTHHCGAWLRTEYDTAVIRAHNAADWQSFLRNKDVMPNLRWMPTTSPNPESSHRKFWEKKLTLPVDDPFWTKHHPGDRWNCKCSLEATDDPVNRPDDIDGVDPPQRGLENNPGKDGHTFSDNHPYFPESCRTCQFNKGLKNKMGTFFLNQKKHCFQCSKVDFVIPSTKNGVKKLTPQQKHEIYSMPLQKQFEKVGKNIYRHKLKATDEEDYNKLLDVAKAYSASGMKVWLLPEVHKNEVGVRKLLSLPSETKTPDMMLNRSILVDVKSPESYRKIEHNANKASKQGGIACITNHSMHLVYSKLEALSKQILNNKEYMKDEVHFYIDGTIYKYNSQGRILD